MLQVSDLHLTPSNTGRREWVRSLAGLEPDLVINTGDNLAHRDAVPEVLEALGPLLDRPGAFVLGSNDYYSPTIKNPLRYLAGDTGARTEQRHIDLPWGDLVSGLRAGGWADLSNARTSLTVGGVTIALRGVDDPHIHRDVYGAVAGPVSDDEADITLGVVHAPYLRVTDAMAADGVPLIFAGHTHGGQVAVPGYGALVSNCDLPREARQGAESTLRRHAAARVGRARDLALRTDPLRLPARGHAHHPGTRHSPLIDEPVWGARSRRAILSVLRGVAQLGSALRSGRRGRGFKSRHPDQSRPVSLQVRGTGR